jgi:hypothetical protein
MSEHTNNPNFRYNNDNRETNVSKYNYPSQQEISPGSKKGDRDYYPNDNGGRYPNSNRQYTSLTDKQSPNSNYNPS